MLTSAFIFVTFSTGIQTLNNYGFDVEKSNLWSGIAALAALFFTMGINRFTNDSFSNFCRLWLLSVCTSNHWKSSSHSNLWNSKPLH